MQVPRGPEGRSGNDYRINGLSGILWTACCNNTEVGQKRPLERNDRAAGNFIERGYLPMEHRSLVRRTHIRYHNKFQICISTTRPVCLSQLETHSLDVRLHYLLSCSLFFSLFFSLSLSLSLFLILSLSVSLYLCHSLFRQAIIFYLIRWIGDGIVL